MGEASEDMLVASRKDLFCMYPTVLARKGTRIGTVV